MANLGIAECTHVVYTNRCMVLQLTNHCAVPWLAKQHCHPTYPSLSPNTPTPLPAGLLNRPPKSAPGSSRLTPWSRSSVRQQHRTHQCCRTCRRHTGTPGMWGSQPASHRQAQTWNQRSHAQTSNTCELQGRLEWEQHMQHGVVIPSRWRSYPVQFLGMVLLTTAILLTAPMLCNQLHNMHVQCQAGRQQCTHYRSAIGICLHHFTAQHLLPNMP